ncbi:Protein-methionine-sulfoxide reductase catalytic subunit MsrP like [Heracleum sosnowskyi]|uniref:Protein-methionine-sulfoxide reductase catalytic subunit MsrP like n=1 Tax=Heracleum sosnowskyi TaxID=360622 RepID=A0AAD8GN64_9APIA|nr:Protein-methionine-sulfoxide reductase catalytic subunit MsrP like [Heracleum sosnowskyi]
MACDFQMMKTSSRSIQFHLTSPSIFLPFLKHQYHYHHQLSYLSTYPLKPISHKSRIYPLLISSSLSPPRSKEEAILQAKTSLSTALDKPLNNAKLAGKFKKLKQPKFRVEIPVVDDESPDCLSQLALQIFGDMPVKIKGSAIKILILWPDPTLKEAGIKSFGSYSKNTVVHMDILSANNRNLGSNDIAVFVAPETSQLSDIKAVSDSFYPRPIAIFNPRWGFDEEATFGELRGFVASFEVVYSFTGLEVRGILSRRKGVIFRTVLSSGAEWSVWVEEGDLKLVSKFKARPSIVEVENVLYNLMAINSPITKSVKFFRDMVSNVTGKE